MPVPAALLLVKKIPRQVWYLLGIGLLGWFIFWQGQQNIQRKWDASREAGRAIVSRLKQQSTIIVRSVETVHVEKTKVIKEKGDTIVKQVKVYIPVDSPDLPSGFRILHDAAVANSPAGTASESAQPVPLRTAAETIFGNYATCHLMNQELDAVRQLYDQLRQNALAQCKQPGVVCSEDTP